MTTATLPAPIDVGTDDELVHFYCDCDPDTSWCGLDISGEPETPDDPNECPLCVIVDQAGGPDCCEVPR